MSDLSVRKNGFYVGRELPDGSLELYRHYSFGEQLPSVGHRRILGPQPVVYTSLEAAAESARNMNGSEVFNAVVLGREYEPMGLWRVYHFDIQEIPIPDVAKAEQTREPVAETS